MTSFSTMQQILDLLDMGRFRQWLEQYDEDQIVGFLGDPDHDPIAKYLRENDQHVMVGTETITPIRCIGCHVVLPEWVTRFIGHIDSTMDHDAEEITASRAIECLNLVESELRTG